MPNVLFSKFLHVIDASGIIPRLEAWHTEDSINNAGRKSTLPMRAGLMALLLNSYWGNGYSYKEVAASLFDRITKEQASRLGYNPDECSYDEWYHRAWRTMQRILETIDPWHHTKGLGKRLTGDQYAIARDLYDPTREDRAHEMARLFVRASIELLPKKYLAGYKGDVALDSTFMRVQGFINPNDYSKRSLRIRKGMKKRDMLNGDYQCEWYTREGDHDGSDKKHSLPGYELDTTVMIDAKNGAFPFPLITGISFHRPAEIAYGARSTIEQHSAFTAERGLVVVDRAFNGLASEQFQEPVRKLRYETVYDYKRNDLGAQGSVPGKPIIIIDGVPYVNRMPESYIMISRWHAEGEIDPATGEPYTTETRDEIFEARAAYRMKAKGKVDSDGHQRFEYPNPRSYLAFDPATGKSTTDNPTGSVTIGLEAKVIKHLQKFPWMSTEWLRAYGQRNQVEMSNRLIKDHRSENIGNAASRPARGFAYNYLVAMIATVSTNIRRIIVGITNLNTLDDNGQPKQRVRKRRDSNGYRLARNNQPTIHETGEQILPPDLARE
ncbi:hypothetical protein [Leucobacter sp. NPDC077196]|uniref:hypothetical protein n=1 Tax=Leucobacter sp. NPDC077196 TaxID=3154959 RepID=UPI0034348DDF